MNGYGEVLYNTSRDFFVPLQGEEKYCTEGFKELALIYGATEASYRKTAALLNRARHQEDGGTPSRTLRETTEQEGVMIQEHLEQKASRLFQAHGFTREGQPQAALVAPLAPPPSLVGEESVPVGLPSNVGPAQGQSNLLPSPLPDEDAQAVRDLSEEGVGTKTLNALVTAGGLSEQSRSDMVKNPVSYEDAQEAVNISVDEVGAKKQKETREQKPHGPPAKKKRAYIHNTVIHVEHGGKLYMLNGYGVPSVLRLLLAFLLENQLVSHPFIFFVDGHSLYAAVVQFFSWHTKVSVILDWYHLRKKCRELLSMALKGSKLRNAVLEKLMPLLWYGLVDQAIDYLSTLPAAQIKNQDERLHLLTYLSKNRPMIPVYAVRRKLGLRNSSNRGEKANDLLVAERQKHNGMSWSKSGSVALASVTALKQNQEYPKWFRARELEFKLAS